MALGCTALAGSNAFADPNCVTAYGKTACGYNCTSGYGDVQCSRTPQGACEAAYGKVKCMDPGYGVYEKATCITGYGDIACGYNCVSGYGEVACSRSPYGACDAAYGQVMCWDPAPWVQEKAECKSGYGTIACGYHCVAAYGEVKCASTPNGFCRTANGTTIQCWE